MTEGPAKPASGTPITEIMTRTFTCARGDIETPQLGEWMLRDWIGCIPVVGDKRRPEGMVTKLDLVERHGEARPSPPTAAEVMMPFAISLRDTATVAQAAALMAAEDIHHLPICDASGAVVGIVSSMDIVRWVAKSRAA